ncbi:MAG TPA: glycosyltransferase family 2 protein [Candidatus Polarisedimenticolaceae bacterium]
MILALAALALAALPAALFFRNRAVYLPPPFPTTGRRPPAVSVLIPARNEEISIGAALEAVRKSRGIEFEVVVLDDGSTDATAAIVRDAGVRLESAPPLPPGWCGKQHACHVLASHARHEVLVFVDADVRLAPDALARMAAFVEDRGVDLASGFPRQETVTFLEKLLLPMMHWVLLGFLPIDAMRRRPDPSFGAGCGQLFVAKRDAYAKAGGHAAIRASLHDGVKLPRAFRAAGWKTDLFDATDLATCRMYRNAGEVWRGLAKNATEGMASPGGIVPWTVLLGGGHVLPFVLLALGIEPLVTACACALSLAPRVAAAARFRQSLPGAVLHPIGVAVLLSIQWTAFLGRLAGRRPSWKGRSYGEADAR